MYYFHRWQSYDVQPDADEWERAQKLMAWSLRLDASNAGYTNDQGRLYEYTANRLTKSETRRIFLLIKAAANFRLASSLRPTWPVAWANLALVKSALGSSDEEFSQAIGNAMRLGKAYPVIYVPVIEAAISQWQQLSNQLRSRVLYQIKIALGSKVRLDILNVIREHKMCVALEQQGLSMGSDCYEQ